MRGERHAHIRALLEAGLNLGWLRRNGSATPQPWDLPGEFIEVFDGEVEVNLSATFKFEVNESTVWSRHASNREGAVHCWEWTLGVRFDDLSREEADRLDELEPCYGDRDISFLSDGDHRTKPEVPDAVVAALAILTESF